MLKIEIILTEQEIMKSISKKRSTFYHWKKTKPKEYELVREALMNRKMQKKLEGIIDGRRCST